MKLLNKKLNTDVCINFQYNSAIVDDYYTFERYEECKEFILEHGLSSGDAEVLLSYAESYVESHDINDYCTIYFSILGDKLVYSHYWMYIKERIQSFRDEKLLLRKDLLRIIECSDWHATHNEAKHSVVVKYNNNGDKLDWLIYVYKDYIIFSNREGKRRESMYRCENFCFIYDKDLEN